MVRYYSSAGATLRSLGETFGKWGVEQWGVSPQRRGSKWPRETREVTVWWVKPTGQRVELPCSQEPWADDNLRALYLCIEAIRLQEKRGVGALMSEAYKQLAAPAGAVPRRDPWEVLGLAPGSPVSVIKAAHKALAMERHPDHGGSTEAMAELNDARDALIGPRVAD